LTQILGAGYIALTESNLNTLVGNCGVVWLTDSPQSEGHGLLFDPNIPVDLDKTRIRMTVRYKATFKHWDEWSNKKGINPSWKESLISTASAEEAHKTWYVSERVVHLIDVLKIENIVTGEVIPVEMMAKTDTVFENSLLRPETTDMYILSQPGIVQIRLLETRKAIRDALPNATEKMSQDMPTYWQGQNIIQFAAQKNYLGLFLGAEAIEHFAPRLTEYKTGKGTIQFPYDSLRTEQFAFIGEIAAWCGKEYAK
jgi:uncharacterized protein YdhG (YjbR/CyaY superfamily)